MLLCNIKLQDLKFPGIFVQYHTTRLYISQCHCAILFYDTLFFLFVIVWDTPIIMWKLTSNSTKQTYLILQSLIFLYQFLVGPDIHMPLFNEMGASKHRSDEVMLDINLLKNHTQPKYVDLTQIKKLITHCWESCNIFKTNKIEQWEAMTKIVENK